MQEDEGYRRYQKLEQELGQIPAWDDRFEAVLMKWKNCRAVAKKGMELMKDAKEQLQKLRKKALIRQIKRMDQEHLATYEFAISNSEEESDRHVPKNSEQKERRQTVKPRL